MVAVVATMISVQANASQENTEPGSYRDLVALFAEWRAFEQPPDRDGAPDYTAATFTQRHTELKAYQQRLAAINPGSWPVEQQVDYQLVRAEMNGMDFYIRVLQPWARDPAFYTTVWTDQSDTPAHEGPTHHHLAELWTYEYPLSAEAEAKLAAELSIIPPLLDQARLNLTGNARDLWVTGTGSMQKQVDALDALAQKTAGSGKALRQAIHAAREATASFVGWLGQQAPSKDGPSGIGKDNYSWGLRNVHLVPMTWDEEVAVLKSELARAHASLKLEEERNRALPPLPVIATPEEYQQRANEAVTKFIAYSARPRHVPDARLHGPGAARANGRIRADREAQLLCHRDSLRAADPLHALLPLVGSRPDAR